MKRLLSLFLAMLLLFSVVPLNAFAAEGVTVETETAEPVDLPAGDEAEPVDPTAKDEAELVDPTAKDEAEPVDLPVEKESEFPVLLDSGNVTLTGTVTLPEGQTAPAAGLRGYVQCWLADSTKYKKDFTIAAGQNAQSWTLDVPANA